MSALGPSECLAAWEAARARAPAERALSILAAVGERADWDRLLDLPLGVRDRCLLALYSRHCGTRLASYAVCPACAQRLEYTIELSQLGLDLDDVADRRFAGGETAPVHRCAFADKTIVFRSPNSRDLIAAAACGSVEEAQRRILRNCVLRVDGLDASDFADLPADIVEALAAAMERVDAGAEILLALTCIACGHGWTVVFEPSRYLVAEIEEACRSLLYEVSVLARAYGWSEPEILAMNATRRRVYFELAARQ